MKPSERMDLEAILRKGRPAAVWALQQPRAKLIAAGAGALLLLGTVWLFSGTGTPVRYVTEPIVRGNLTVVVTSTGSVQPINKADVSSELSGTVRKVLVDFNSVVKAGQPLAVLDTDKLLDTVQSSRAKVSSARAKIADAEATIVEKERDLARKRSLADKQFASTQDLDVAQAAHDRAVAALASVKADVEVAEADLRLNETNLRKATITSPINGVVLTRNVDPGQTVASSLQAPVLFSIAEDLTKMELRVDVDEADVGKVKSGQKASFTVDAFPERRFPATIRDVRYASETIQGVVTYKAVLTVDNSELLLRPGMTATSEIRVTEISDALIVPNAALRFSPTAATGSTDSRSFLQRILPGPPPFRTSAKRDSASNTRTVWLLKSGALTSIEATVGASDGRKTEVRGPGLEAGLAVVVDQVTTKK